MSELYATCFLAKCKERRICPKEQISQMQAGFFESLKNYGFG